MKHQSQRKTLNKTCNGSLLNTQLPSSERSLSPDKGNRSIIGKRIDITENVDINVDKEKIYRNP